MLVLFARPRHACLAFFFFNDTATTEIYTLSLHDALPIYRHRGRGRSPGLERGRHPAHLGEEGRAGMDARLAPQGVPQLGEDADRKSTRLNSSHLVISYAVFCLKTKTHMAVLDSSCVDSTV